MSALADLRRRYPEYAAKSDEELAGAIYDKHYAKGPYSRAQVFEKLGVKTVSQPMAAALGATDYLTGNFTDELGGRAQQIAKDVKDGRYVDAAGRTIGAVTGSVYEAIDGVSRLADPARYIPGLKGRQAMPAFLKFSATEGKDEAGYRDDIRDLQVRARTERPLSYHGAGIGSTLALAMLGKTSAPPSAAAGAAAPKGIEALKQWAERTALPAMTAGTGFGTLSTVGDARGDSRQRLDVGVDALPANLAAAALGITGVVPPLIARAGFDPANTVAMVCGPEVMMRFSAGALVDAGVPAGAVHLSMERSMKCAAGFCGHCQFGPVFVCRDGAVFGFDAIRGLIATKEI